MNGPARSARGVKSVYGIPIYFSIKCNVTNLNAEDDDKLSIRSRWMCSGSTLTILSGLVCVHHNKSVDDGWIRWTRNKLGVAGEHEKKNSKYWISKYVQHSTYICMHCARQNGSHTLFFLFLCFFLFAPFFVRLANSEFRTT